MPLTALDQALKAADEGDEVERGIAVRRRRAPQRPPPLNLRWMRRTVTITVSSGNHWRMPIMIIISHHHHSLLFVAHFR